MKETVSILEGVRFQKFRRSMGPRTTLDFPPPLTQTGNSAGATGHGLLADCGPIQTIITLLNLKF